MINISLHIEYLLLRHDCVILPGFGAFIAAHHSARRDENGVWTPMYREISFNKLISNDDGLLANSFARKYSLDFASARELLRQEIESLKENLNQDREFTLGNLGVLRISEDNTIVFTPISSPLGETENIGFHKIGKFRVLEAAEPVQESESLNEVVAEEASETILCGRKFDTARNYYIAVNKIFAKTAACIAVVALVCCSIFIPSSETDNREDRASVVPVGLISNKDKSSDSEDIKSKENILSESKEQNTPESENTQGTIISCAQPYDNQANSPAVAESQSSDDKDRYFLIVGTFRSENEAQKYIASKPGSSYHLQNIPTKTLNRVSAYSSTDKTELIAILNSAEFQAAFPEAWIWKK